MTELHTSESGPRWRPYPAYKDSGVPWLRKIPAHWELNRLKFCCQINPPKTEIAGLPKELEVSFLPMERIGENGNLSLEETRTIEDSWEGYSYFRNEDVIVAKITPCFENGKAALCQGLLNGLGFGTTELHVLRSYREHHSKFLFYLTKSEPFRKLGTAGMYGAAGQKRVPETFIKDFKIGLPSFEEQQIIVDFLDQELAKIDDLVMRKERQIELLQEKRTALISRAVTRGLDPNVPLKDSGIDWLGHIPAHWEVKRLKFCCNINPSKAEISDIPKDLEISFLPMERIGEYGELNLEETSSIRDSWEGYSYFRNEDVIVAKITPCFENGKGAICQGLLNGLGFGTTELHVLRGHKDLFSKFLYFITKSAPFRKLGTASMYGAAGQKRVPESFIKDFIIGLPRFEEQQKIIKFLELEMAKIDALITKIRKSIERLKEYRTALISAAVTGKIDVRKEVSR
jgi:restriction endonuclease S subunit